jgi:predicted  nucleic acid-binding Zn-ribbon protein
MALDPAWIALIGTIFGGVGLKVAEHWLGKSKVKVDEAGRIRDELRLEITAQREEIKQLEADVDKWRDEYFNLKEKYLSLKSELDFALLNIRKEAVDAEKRAAELTQSSPAPILDKPSDPVV